jgi:hypothetical protein
MKVFTLVQIIERDCDVNVWTFKSFNEAINLKNKLAFDFATAYGVTYSSEKEEDGWYFCFMSSGGTDQQFIIKETEL